jgi:autotransporter passenger strand-loop-strand repeat protein
MSGTSGTIGAFTYTPGDLVISVVGTATPGANLPAGGNPDNAAAPLVLEEIDPTTGAIVASETLNQTSYINAAGVTENAISAEYGSSSEGQLSLSADGTSLVIAGYDVNAAAYNAYNLAGASATSGPYGSLALAQTYTIPTIVNGQSVTLVPRVVADISWNGTVDTSTALLNIFDTQNPRGVTTANGTSFYLAGQGVKGSTNQGVFYATDGASSATAIDTSADFRQAYLISGALYVTVDSKQVNGGQIDNFGVNPTTLTSGTALVGIGPSVTLNGANGNNVNLGSGTVNLSPESIFFANSTTLYVADGGQPKEGGVGDGGLQKWSLINGTWTLDYTLSDGLNIVPTGAASGTTGVVELTGVVNSGGTVTLYATNSNVGDLDQTYLYKITDTLADTTNPGNETFTVLETAASGTNIRGVAFAPTAPTVTGGGTISGGQISASTVYSGAVVSVLSGGVFSGGTILSAGSASIVAGGVDSGSLLALYSSETVLGSANADTIYGTQLVSAATATVTNEIVGQYGQIDLFLKGAQAINTTILSGGKIVISGNANATNTVLSGGSIILESGAAGLSGTLTEIGPNNLIIQQKTDLPTTSSGDQAVITGFGTGDVIDLTFVASGAAALTESLVSGNSVATVTSNGTAVAQYTFGGTALLSGLTLKADGTGTDIVAGAAPVSSGNPGNVTISGGVTSSGIVITSGSLLTVLSGGTALHATIQSGASATIGGVDSASIIANGGSELVTGSAVFDSISGIQNLNIGTASAFAETVFSGGALELTNTGAQARDITVQAGGTMFISKNVDAIDTTLNGGELIVNSPKATFEGSLTFNGPGGDLQIETVNSAGNVAGGFGALATISGFGPGDVIDITAFGAASFTSVTSVISGGNTYLTVSSGTGTESSETFEFAGTNPGVFLSSNDAAGHVEIAVSVTSITSAVTVNSGASLVNFVVTSGGALTVASGATVSNGDVTSGALILSGGTDIHTLIGPSGTETAAGSGAVVSGASILSGGVITVSSGASTSNVNLSSGGSLIIGPGGREDPTTISAGASNIVSGAGAIGSGTVVLAGGTEIVISGGVESGGSDFGLLVISSGGTTIGETISAGGLLVNSGATISAGAVNAGGTEFNTTILAGGTELTYGNAFGDIVDGTQLVSGATSLISGETVGSGGAIDLLLAGEVASGTVVEAGGSIFVNGKAYLVNTVLSGGTVILGSPKASTSGTFTFASGTLDITSQTSVNSQTVVGPLAVINGFGAGDIIDITWLNPTGTTVTSVTSGANTDVVFTSGGKAVETLIFAGTNYTSGTFKTQADAATGLEIVPCYAPGTRILTLTGEVPVESIAPGDILVTVREGGPATRRVIWTGRRTVDLTRHPHPAAVQPIRIAAGAIAPGIPQRDLRVSPNHALYLDGCLFEAQALINGVTIRQENLASITYHHVELDAHDIILAEGCPAESFLDTGNRHMFAGGVLEALHPDFAAPANAPFCATLVREGLRLDLIRASLTARVTQVGTRTAA